MAQNARHQQSQFGFANFRVNPIKLLSLFQKLERFLVRPALLSRFHQPEQRSDILPLALAPQLGYAIGYPPVSLLFRPVQPFLESFRMSVRAASSFIQDVGGKQLGPWQTPVTARTIRASYHILFKHKVFQYFLGQVRGDLLDDLRHVQREHSVPGAVRTKPLLFESLPPQFLPYKYRLGTPSVSLLHLQAPHHQPIADVILPTP